MSKEQEIKAGEKAATHLAAIRLRHRRIKSGLPFDICGRCQTCWPCDASILLAQLKDREEKLAPVRLKAIKSHIDGWTDCMLCGTTWRTDVDEEYHTDCPLDRILQGGE